MHFSCLYFLSASNGWANFVPTALCTVVQKYAPNDQHSNAAYLNDVAQLFFCLIGDYTLSASETYISAVTVTIVG